MFVMKNTTYPAFRVNRPQRIVLADRTFLASVGHKIPPEQ